MTTAELLRGYDLVEPEERNSIQIQVDRISLNGDSVREHLRDRAVSDVFRHTLQQNALALDRLKADRPPSQKVIETTTAVADDLEVKATFLSVLGPGHVVSDARVRARTKKGNTEEPGYRVWYVVRGLADDANEYRTFPLLSTPTEHDVPPGAYLMWTERPDDGAKGVKTPVDVGKAGQVLTEVHLPVPPSER
jgi:hypothetical protein